MDTPVIRLLFFNADYYSFLNISSPRLRSKCMLKSYEPNIFFDSILIFFQPRNQKDLGTSLLMPGKI